jgi:hypothetical protein
MTTHRTFSSGRSERHPHAQDVDKVALYLIGDRKSSDFYNGLLDWVLVSFQFHVTVLPNRVSCPRIASLGLSEASGIDHCPLVEPARELQMGVARENNIRSRAGLLAAFLPRRNPAVGTRRGGPMEWRGKGRTPGRLLDGMRELEGPEETACPPAESTEEV